MSHLRGDPLFILMVLSSLIVLSEWLVRRTALRHLGTALLVILLTALVANVGLIPAGSTAAAPVPVYDAIFAYVAPIALFWLLLPVNLRGVLKAGVPLIALFLIGAVGSMAGAILFIRLVDGPRSIGPLYDAIAGMFAATYIGGSVNFNALALHYNVVREGTLYGGAIVADNIVTTIWIVVTLTAPRVLARVWAERVTGGRTGGARRSAVPITELAAETETIDPRKLALLIALGLGALLVAGLIAGAFADGGIAIPAILIVTTIALLLAQIPRVSSLPGARVMAMYAVYLFLAVIGAFCDIRAMSGLGMLGVVLLLFATGLVLVHGVVVFGVAWAFRMDLDAAALASQANVGGSTTAIALAKSLGREDLLLPGILLGSLGNAIGTFLGFAVVRLA